MQLKSSLKLACVRLITAVIDGVRDDLTSSLNTRLDICLPAVFACFSPVCSYLSCYSLCERTYERRLRGESAVRAKPTIKAALTIKGKVLIYSEYYSFQDYRIISLVGPLGISVFIICLLISILNITILATVLWWCDIRCKITVFTLFL